MPEKGRYRGKTVGVFLGGESSEREVSLRTGAAAAAAIRRLGYPVREIDLCGGWLDGIRNAGVDVAFLALHGRFGEDGCIQGALELARIPYTGSGVAASALSMSKVLAKRVAASAGVPVAPDALYAGSPPDAPPLPGLGFPFVVKPDREGSTVGIRIVRGPEDWVPALSEARKFDSRVLVEAYIPGREITVGILNGRVLPAIEIVPKSGSGFYDYQSKYTAGQTEYVIPVPMDRDILVRAAEYTRKASAALTLRGAARLDYRVDPAGNLFFLEANTIPGMTETSLLPKAAKFDGMTFDELVEEILDDAGLGK
ncbi:MAG TPA: D-alanine--D-alanine ligase [Candidatus Deferrimicrobiaceae bacterium]|nr:D-alanine--D-alanine ligase [Candidatus Deferrimicrobiaceae bacterium]